jgi:hypothetical protein
MKSKQLTFEVSEDGELAKRIVGLVLDPRVNCSSNKVVSSSKEVNLNNKEDEEID